MIDNFNPKGHFIELAVGMRSDVLKKRGGWLFKQLLKRHCLSCHTLNAFSMYKLQLKKGPKLI